MTAAFLIQLLISALALAGIVGLVAWLGVPRQCDPVTDALARQMLAEDYPDDQIGSLWLAPDGRCAIARSEDQALILYRAGDGHVSRAISFKDLTLKRRWNGEAVIDLGDVAAPRVCIALDDGAAWPPAELSA